MSNLLEQLKEKDKVTVSPLDPDYKGRYPALIKKDGKFANRKTGEIYLTDPKSGRQVERLRNGRKAGRYIEKNGIPYGTVEYTVIERDILFIRARAKPLASGNEQEVLILKEGVYYGR